MAPVPLRHQALQPSPDAWIRTPSPPSGSSRTISPMTPIRGGFPRASGNHSYASFSAVMGAGKEPVLSQEEEQAFGRRWSCWMHRNGVKHWVVPCTLLASVLVRWCIGLGSYSGTSSDYTYFYTMTSWSRCTQGRGRSPCSKTMRPKGIGWRSRITCQRDVRPAILGFRLPPADRVSSMALRQNVRCAFFCLFLRGFGFLRDASLTRRAI